MKHIKAIGWVIYRKTIDNVIGFIKALWFLGIIMRYSYNGAINRFERMSRNRQEFFESCLYSLIYDRGEDQRGDDVCDSFIQRTYGLSNMVDLYNYVKDYNETHSEEAA